MASLFVSAIQYLLVSQTSSAGFSPFLEIHWVLLLLE